MKIQHLNMLKEYLFALRIYLDYIFMKIFLGENRILIQVLIAWYTIVTFITSEWIVIK